MNPYDLQFQRAFQELSAKIDKTAGGLRRYTDEKIARDLELVMGAMKARRSGAQGFGSDDANPVRKDQDGNVIRLEDIPGRRIPYMFVVEIPVGANETAEKIQSVTISQDGPFVATRRCATFLSQHVFAYTDPDTNLQATFNGRSNGRFRPVNSVDDLLDAQLTTLGGIALDPSKGLPGVAFGEASNVSGFRTMEWDGYISTKSQGSGYPRQNHAIPSSFWSRVGAGAGIELPALDFFERGEVIEFAIQPTHPQNPPYGNAAGLLAWGPTAGTSYPFLAGQYDVHEGIATPNGFKVVNQAPVILTSDPITRLPDGILLVALEGYRIIQPPGAPF